MKNTFTRASILLGCILAALSPAAFGNHRSGDFALPEIIRTGDFNGDGILDLLVNVSGFDHIAMFQGDGQGNFTLKRQFETDTLPKGLVVGDVDNDGDTDFLVTNNNGPARLFLNQVGNRNHWVGLRVVGKSGRDMLGAVVEIVVGENNTLRRRVKSDGSFLSGNDPRVLVGLGGATRVKAVRVRWLGGAVEEWKGVLVDRYTTLKEGTAH